MHILTMNEYVDESKAFSMNDARACLLVLLLGYPHVLETR